MLAEIPAGHIGIAGMVGQLAAAEATLGPLERTDWLSLLPVAADDPAQIICLFFRDAGAAQVASRVLPGGAAVLAPGTQISVRRDGFGRWLAEARCPDGSRLRLAPEGASVV